MKLARRQLLQALGFGALASVVAKERGAEATEPSFPTRILFYLQPHGHVPKAWNMAMPGQPTDRFAERDLRPLSESELSPTLRPLHAFRDRLLPIEGLANITVLADYAEILRAGVGDRNAHQLGVAGLLTANRALQRDGLFCTGGAISLDQVLARRATGTVFGSRVYGFDYTPVSEVSSFSFLGPGQATPMVTSPKAAFDDLLGVFPAPVADSRAAKLAAQRSSVLDTVGREYELLAPQLGAEDRRKLEQHRALVRDLERSVHVVSKTPSCQGSFDGSGDSVRQFMSLARLAFSCDLTRVITFTAPVPEPTVLGYPAEGVIHDYAHASIEGDIVNGYTFSETAARAMTDLDAWHAGHVAYLLRELDAIPEGSGTLLDHTIVVWLTEHATPTHAHHDVMTLLAGGGNGFFRTGRYVRYPRTLPSPLEGMGKIGPGHNRLLVSLLKAMGQPDTEFGMNRVDTVDGSIALRGPLTELHRA